jgi:hypothetical protein
MRWNGAGWESIPISADGNFDTNPYVAALMDLTENAPNGTFMNMLVRDLIAKTAMITYLASHLLEIQNHEGRQGAIFGGERFSKSGTGVVDNDPTGALGLAGFKMGVDGILKASGAVLNNIDITGNSRFQGAVDATVLVVNQEPLYSQWRETGLNKNVLNFVNEEFAYYGITPDSISGTFLSKDIQGSYSSIGVKHITYITPSRGGAGDVPRLELVCDDNTVLEFYRTETISGLQFRYITNGWNVSMNNIPVTDPKAIGALWRDGTDLKISNG